MSADKKKTSLGLNMPSKTEYSLICIFIPVACQYIWCKSIDVMKLLRVGLEGPGAGFSFTRERLGPHRWVFQNNTRGSHVDCH